MLSTYTRRNVVNVSSDRAFSRTSTSALLRLKITELVILQTNNCAINYAR